MSDHDEDRRLDQMPDHERDEDRTVGGGLMTEGGTAIVRGTGTLDGTAQDHEMSDDDEDEAGVDLDVGADDSGDALNRDR
jgi:hypothetical protein